MKILLLLPLLLGFSVPAIAHNENNGGCSTHCERGDIGDFRDTSVEMGEEGADLAEGQPRG